MQMNTKAVHLTQEEVALGALAVRETMTAAEFAAIGVGRTTLKRLVDGCQIARLVDGTFAALHVVGEQATALAATTKLSATRGRVVVVLFSAARLHGFHDEPPTELWVAMPGVRSPKRGQVGGLELRACLWPDYKLSQASGVVSMRTYGRDMLITSPARTVVDIWKYRGKLSDDRYTEEQVAEMIRRGVEAHGIDFAELRRLGHATRTDISGLDAVLSPSAAPRF
jgi:predicted transcriptional regulator of viral defense system